MLFHVSIYVNCMFETLHKSYMPLKHYQDVNSKYNYISKAESSNLNVTISQKSL